MTAEDPDVADPTLSAARGHLPAAPAAAIAALHGRNDAAAAWVRALASATRGDAVGASVALRHASRDAPLPEHAPDDVARGYAAAVLADVAPDLGGWRVLAAAVLAPTPHPVTDDVELAWVVTSSALERRTRAGDLGDDAGLILALAGLAVRLERIDLATDLARSAQDAAVRADDADALAAATLLLAGIVRRGGDEALAEAVVTHGVRLLRRVDATVAATLPDRWASARDA